MCENTFKLSYAIVEFESISQIKVQVSTDNRLSGPAKAETVCIQPRSSIARRLEVSAKQDGAARLRIRASTATDPRCTNHTGGQDVR